MNGVYSYRIIRLFESYFARWWITRLMMHRNETNGHVMDTVTTNTPVGTQSVQKFVVEEMRLVQLHCSVADENRAAERFFSQ